MGCIKQKSYDLQILLHSGQKWNTSRGYSIVSVNNMPQLDVADKQHVGEFVLRLDQRHCLLNTMIFY